MAADATGEREMSQELRQAGKILADLRINFGVAPFQISVRQNRRRAVPGPGDVEHVQIVFFYQPIGVQVNKA